MIPILASKIAEITGGVLHGPDRHITACPILKSSEAQPGSLFLAYEGNTVDGHDFAEDAFKHGAVVALTSKKISGPCIVVADVTKALGELAAHVRNELSSLSVIAITGSQGKTTTKDLLKDLLVQIGPTVAPAGNYNNEIGAPLTLLECDAATKFCIIEMGARHIGDIAKLCAIARPNIGVVLKVGTAHVGIFGSVESIAQAKSEIISALPTDGVAILGGYDPQTLAMASLHGGRKLIFGEMPEADVRAADIDVREGCAHFDLVTPAGRAPVALRIVGLHQVANALAVASIGTALSIPLDQIASALSMSEPQSKWRMEISEVGGVVLINDAYNASPEAVDAALRTLIHFAQERGGRAWAFLGKMNELGESSEVEHARIGTLASVLGVDHLVCVAAPEYALEIKESEMAIHRVSDKGAARALGVEITSGDVILVKASRSERLEQLSNWLSMDCMARDIASELHSGVEPKDSKK